MRRFGRLLLCALLLSWSGVALAAMNNAPRGHADGTDCPSGQYARGTDAQGNAELCTADDDSPDNDSEVPDDITVASSADLASSGKLQLGHLTPASASCVAIDTDRPYADKDCDGIKDAGEEYLDVVSGGSNHDMLSATHTDTTAATVVRGDLMTGQLATPKWQRLALGSSGTFLRSDGTDLAYASIADADVPDTITASNYILKAGDTAIGDLQFTTGKALRTGTADTNTLLLQARDVDGSSWTTFATLTAANTPTFDLSSSTTVGGAAIQTGTDDDVPESGDFGNAADLDATGAVTAASTTTAGKVELAIASETTTGSSTTLAVTPDGLRGSDYGKRVVYVILLDDTTDTAVKDGTGDITWVSPAIVAGYNIVDVECGVEVAGTTNTTDFQVHNLTQAADVLSTKCTVDSAETSSLTAATAPVISATEDDITSGDRYRFDIDAISTTAAKGAWVELTLQKP